MRYLAVLLCASGFLFCNLQAQNSQNNVEITSYHITVQEFAKPRVVIQNGEKKLTQYCYIVNVLGKFPTIDLQLFIGNQILEDIKISKNKISFVVYNISQFRSLSGSAFSYAIKGGPIEISSLIFHPIVLVEQFKEQAIHIKSCKVSVLDLDIPMTVGKKTYTKAYTVSLEGNFLKDRAIPVEIYVGDYKVPEYGGSEAGIYFYIYEQQLFKKLQNQPIAYGFDNKKWKIFPLYLNK